MFESLLKYPGARSVHLAGEQTRKIFDNGNGIAGLPERVRRFYAEESASEDENVLHFSGRVPDTPCIIQGSQRMNERQMYAFDGRQ
jgi:hypothetical protein